MAVTSDRKVQDLEGDPVAQQRKSLALDVVIASRDGRRGGCTMSDLDVGAIWVGGVMCRRATNDHPLVERVVLGGPKHEVTPGAADGAVARRHGSEHVAQRAVVWPPELIGIGIDHPVGAKTR